MQNSKLCCVVLFCAGISFSYSEEASIDEALKLSKAGKHKESEKVLREIITKKPTDSVAWFNLGNSFFRQEKFKFASKAYRKVIALRSPLRNPATLYLAKSLRFQGKLDEALTIAKSLKNKKILPNLRKLLDLEIVEIQDAQKGKSLKSSLEFYKKEDYAKALESVKETVKKEPTDEAYLLRGMAELQLGLERDAEITLTELKNKSKDAEIKSEAIQLLEDLHLGLWKHPGEWFADIDISAGYNTNVFTNGKSESASESAVSRLGLNAGYFFSQEKSFSKLLAYQLYWEEIYKDSDERSMSHALLFPMGMERGSWLFQLVPSTTYQMQGSDSYVAKVSANGKVQKRLASKQYLSLGLQAEYTRALLSEYDYLEGSFYQGSLNYQLYFDSSDIELSLIYSKENIGSQIYSGLGYIPLSNNNYGPSISYSYKFNKRLELNAGISYYIKKYDSETVPDGVVREDKTFNVWSRLSYLHNSKLSYYIAPSYVDNESNLGASSIADKNFNQWLVLAGVEWTLMK